MVNLISKEEVFHIVKDMPDNCYDCPMYLSHLYGQGICFLTNEMVRDEERAKKRNEYCPLVELKEASRMIIKEDIKFALECANKDIDLMPEREEYMRGYLGGQLSIVEILERHFGKFINDDEIYKENKE